MVDDPGAARLPRPRLRMLAIGAAALAVATAAGGALWWHTAKPAGVAVIHGFDLETAMHLAGAEVPPEVESFYFFVLDRANAGEADELAEKLVVAAGEHEFLGIAGADAAHNRAVLLSALSIDRGLSLAGLVLIYVGPADQEAELAPLVSETGAEFRYVIYQAPPPDAI